MSIILLIFRIQSNTCLLSLYSRMSVCLSYPPLALAGGEGASYGGTQPSRDRPSCLSYPPLALAGDEGASYGGTQPSRDRPSCLSYPPLALAGGEGASYGGTQPSRDRPSWVPLYFCPRG